MMLRCMPRGQMLLFHESLATIRAGTGRRKTKVDSSIVLLHLHGSMKGNSVQHPDLSRWRLVLCGESRLVVKKCSVSVQKMPAFIVGNLTLDIWQGIAL